MGLCEEYLKIANDSTRQQIEYMKAVIETVKNENIKSPFTDTDIKKRRMHKYLIENLSMAELAKQENSSEERMRTYLRLLIAHGNRSMEFNKYFPSCLLLPDGEWDWENKTHFRDFSKKSMDRIKAEARKELEMI